jgi:hypothetical protein
MGSSNLVGSWGRPTTARRTPDRTQIVWGVCLITDFRTSDRGKFNFGGHVGETDYSTAHGDWDRNLDFGRLLHRLTGWHRVALHAATAAYELPPPAATV